MRLIDDKIVYAINQSIPTTSFKGQSDAKQNCKELHETVSYNLIWIREGELSIHISYRRHLLNIIMCIDKKDLRCKRRSGKAMYTAYSTKNSAC